jgi:hypothetical protein
MASDGNRAYRRRIERGRQRGLSPSEARGHPKAGEVGPSQIIEQWDAIPTRAGVVDVEVTGLRQAGTLGAYLRDVRLLGEGEIDDREFRANWRGRQAGGHKLEYDPDRVRAMLRAEGPGPIQRYRRITPPPVRQS